jgi:hypothetical protein
LVDWLAQVIEVCAVCVGLAVAWKPALIAIAATAGSLFVRHFLAFTKLPKSSTTASNTPDPSWNPV